MSKLVKTYYDISKLVFWADGDVVEGKKRARLTFSFRDGNPRIVVFTGVNGPDGIINFPSDYPTMVYVLNTIKEIAKAEPGSKTSIASLGTLWDNDKPTTEKKLVGTAYIGKSKEGLVYLSVMVEDKPKIVFTIRSSPWHKFRDADKNDIPESIISSKLAIGVADLLLNMLSSILLQYTNEEYEEGPNKPTKIKPTNTTSKTSNKVVMDDDIIM